MIDINIEDYTLLNPTYIKKVDGEINLIDIEVEDTNNFFIEGDYGDILVHNCDGYHIAALLINFFHRWFPNIIKNEKLFILQTPLISTNKGNVRKYYYNLSDLEKTTGSVRYLKGLGSLDLKDWEHIFKNMQLNKVKIDAKAEKSLNMAFGDSPELRKRWLKKVI